MDSQFNMISLNELPFEKLFQAAEEKFNQLQYQQAEIYYEAAYKKKSNDDMIVLCYAHILKQNNKSQAAKILLEQAIANKPNGTYKRYFQLAEIYHGEQSITIFEKGIQQAKKGMQNPFLSITPDKEIRRDIAKAYASIAEICMTDLINLPYEQVENKCKLVLELGLQLDPTCMDIHLQMSNCLIQRDQYAQATEQLLIIKKAVIEQQEELEDELILQCSKYLMEVGQHQHSIDVLQKLNDSQNNSPEIVYLLAYCAYQMGKYEQCRGYISEYPQGQTQDPEVEQAMKELKRQLVKKGKQGNDDTEQGGMENDDWQDLDDSDQSM